MDEMIGLFGPNRSNEVAQKNLFLCISSYIDKTQQIMHESTRFQTGDTLKGIVLVLLADEVLVNKQEAGCNISEELVSVAALARLMASSLFRAVSEARTMNAHAQKAGKREKHLELKGQLMGSLELESNAGCCSVGRKADQIVRKILLHAISAGSTSSHKRSVLMLQHFMKLMLVGLCARADFFWKACVLVMSAIMNLMAFEGVEFDALKILAGDAHEPVEATKEW
ncbi:hypothetical protein FCM35_KLT12022 [Carex littledalei]|uniref:DUF7812 domain-containing protein n=1 Tax=Carex littledalei TaxID=544730 RepID=A0A833V2L3_9POAL|nr:hypothetical protein FCM35_KLT12022 [Carex littledalei]